MGPAKKLLPRKQFQVNLLVHKGDQLPLANRIIKWLLSSGRLIVVVVELITISAFVLRYKLDAELIDLKEQIKSKVPYIQSLKADEIAIRQTQFQLATIKRTRAESPNFTQVVTKIAQITPASIQLTNITLDQPSGTPATTLTISGITPSNIELAVFMQALQKDAQLSDITLTNISFEGQIVFTITGNLTSEGGKSN